MLELVSEDDGLAAGGVDAVHEDVPAQVGVYEGSNESGLAQTEPSADVLDPTLHHQGDRVVPRHRLRSEVTSDAIAELL